MQIYQYSFIRSLYPILFLTTFYYQIAIFAHISVTVCNKFALNLFSFKLSMAPPLYLLEDYKVTMFHGINILWHDHSN